MPTRLTHPRALIRAAIVAASCLLVLLASSPGASAHGISSDAEDRSVLGFVPLGIEHMLLGWDHLLFVAGVMLVAGTVRTSAKLISFFVVGHSTTLIAATLAGWRVNPDAVDVVIVLSVAFVGATAMIGTPRRWDWFGLVVFAFGLVHGLGLSTRLQDLGLPEDGLIWRVLAFNVGIEIGQLTAIVGMLGLAAAIGMTLGLDKPGRSTRTAVKVTATALFITGAMTAPLLAYANFTDDNTGSETNLALEANSSCAVGPRSTNLPATGDHPPKRFYGADEEAPLEDFGHSLGDGFLIVLYPADADQADVKVLREFSATDEGRNMLAGPAEAGSPYQALTYKESLSCESFEPEVLIEFATAWNKSLQYPRL